MNGFILGFQRLVWCPKWTPDSNNSFTPMLNTIFLWLKIRPALRRRTIPRNTGLSLMLLWPASALPRRGKPHSLEYENQGRFPFTDCGEREVKVSRKTRSGNSNFVVCCGKTHLGITTNSMRFFRPDRRVLGAPTSRRLVETIQHNAAGRRDASAPRKEKTVQAFELPWKSPVCPCLTNPAWLNFGAHLLAFNHVLLYGH
jgi:hypothetical protein